MKVVVVSGGFDPIHSGHIAYFKSAKKLGEKLIVGTCFWKNGHGSLPRPVQSVSKFCADPRSQCIKSCHKDHCLSGPPPI